MSESRTVFLEEGLDRSKIEVIVTGEIDATLLDALEAFVEHQRVRLDNLFRYTDE